MSDENIFPNLDRFFKRSYEGHFFLNSDGSTKTNNHEKVPEDSIKVTYYKELSDDIIGESFEITPLRDNLKNKLFSPGLSPIVREFEKSKNQDTSLYLKTNTTHKYLSNVNSRIHKGVNPSTKFDYQSKPFDSHDSSPKSLMTVSLLNIGSPNLSFPNVIESKEQMNFSKFSTHDKKSLNISLSEFEIFNGENILAKEADDKTSSKLFKRNDSKSLIYSYPQESLKSTFSSEDLKTKYDYRIDSSVYNSKDTFLGKSQFMNDIFRKTEPKRYTNLNSYDSTSNQSSYWRERLNRRKLTSISNVLK